MKPEFAVRPSSRAAMEAPEPVHCCGSAGSGDSEWQQPHPWPDVEKDNRAIRQAMAELGEDAPLTDLLQRAQRIKETL